MKIILIGAIALCATTTSLFGKSQLSELKTQTMSFKYAVDHKQALHLESVGAIDGQWESPLEGALFTATPCRLGNSPRFISPLEIVTDDGSSGIELIYQSHELDESHADYTHLTITLRDQLRPISVELHQQA